MDARARAEARQLKQDRSLRAGVARQRPHFAPASTCRSENPANRQTVLWELAKPLLQPVFKRRAGLARPPPRPVIAAAGRPLPRRRPAIALAADYCITTPESHWAIREAHWGIVPDMGISVSARGVTAAIFWPTSPTAPACLTAQTALAHGFAARLMPPRSMPRWRWPKNGRSIRPMRFGQQTHRQHTHNVNGCR